MQMIKYREEREFKTIKIKANKYSQLSLSKMIKKIQKESKKNNL